MRPAFSQIEVIYPCCKAGRLGGNYLPVFLTRRSGVELHLHHARQAELDAKRALTLLQAAAAPGTFSSKIGRAYLALAGGLQAQGENTEAHDAFRSATEHLEATLGADHPDTRTGWQG